MSILGFGTQSITVTGVTAAATDVLAVASATTGTISCQFPASELTGSEADIQAADDMSNTTFEWPLSAQNLDDVRYVADKVAHSRLRFASGCPDTFQRIKDTLYFEAGIQSGVHENPYLNYSSLLYLDSMVNYQYREYDQAHDPYSLYLFGEHVPNMCCWPYLFEYTVCDALANASLNKPPEPKRYTFSNDDYLNKLNILLDTISGDLFEKYSGYLTCEDDGCLPSTESQCAEAVLAEYPPEPVCYDSYFESGNINSGETTYPEFYNAGSGEYTGNHPFYKVSDLSGLGFVLSNIADDYEYPSGYTDTDISGSGTNPWDPGGPLIYWPIYTPHVAPTEWAGIVKADDRETYSIDALTDMQYWYRGELLEGPGAPRYHNYLEGPIPWHTEDDIEHAYFTVYSNDYTYWPAGAYDILFPAVMQGKGVSCTVEYLLRNSDLPGSPVRPRWVFTLTASSGSGDIELRYCKGYEAGVPGPAGTYIKDPALTYSGLPETITLEEYNITYPFPDHVYYLISGSSYSCSSAEGATGPLPPTPDFFREELVYRYAVSNGKAQLSKTQQMRKPGFDTFLCPLEGSGYRSYYDSDGYSWESGEEVISSVAYIPNYNATIPYTSDIGPINVYVPTDISELFVTDRPASLYDVSGVFRYHPDWASIFNVSTSEGELDVYPGIETLDATMTQGDGNVVFTYKCTTTYYVDLRYLGDAIFSGYTEDTYTMVYSGVYPEVP